MTERLHNQNPVLRTISESKLGQYFIRKNQEAILRSQKESMRLQEDQMRVARANERQELERLIKSVEESIVSY